MQDEAATGDMWFAARTGGVDTKAIYIQRSSTNVGVGTQTAPTRPLDVNGTQRHRGIAAPAISEANSGTLYFDSALSKYQVSMNGSAYVDLVGSGGVTGSGVANKLTYWTAATNLTDEPNITLGGTYTLDVNGDINLTSVTDSIRSNGLVILRANAALGILSVGGGNTTLVPGDTAVGYTALASVTGAGTGFNTAVGTQSCGGLTTPRSARDRCSERPQEVGTWRWVKPPEPRIRSVPITSFSGAPRTHRPGT